MRQRQTYQPNYLQIPQKPRVAVSYFKDMKTPEKVKPLSALMNLRLFLYKTKQKLEYKKASQFTRNDPLIVEQPDFLFKKDQTSITNQIKFQAYLDGELKPEEYLTLQNYKRLYDITKNDKGSFYDSEDGNQFYTQRESALKKLKERIIHRHNVNKRKRVSEISSQVVSNCDTPALQLAKQLKKTIISKHMNKINESLTAEKTLSTLKMVQNADFAFSQMQTNLQTTVSPRTRSIVASTKHLKIITRRNKTEISPDGNESRVQLNQQIYEDAQQTLYGKKEIKPQKRKVLQFSNDKMKCVEQQSFEKGRCKTERSESKKLFENIEERDDSAESSLCSLFEKKIHYLYNQSIQLKKNILNKDSLIKRIKHMQSFNQVVGEAIATNNQKLYRI